MGSGLCAVAPRCLSTENAGRTTTVLRHALCGDDFHQTPVSITFSENVQSRFVFFFWFCGRCNTGDVQGGAGHYYTVQQAQYSSAGKPIRNTCFECASDSHLLVQRQAAFPNPIYLLPIHRRFRNIVLSARILRTRIFLLTAAILKVSPASNAMRCVVLAAETKTAASSHQQPIT